MKVKKKPTWILEDCFDAESRWAHVRISRNRNTVIVEGYLNGYGEFYHECTLEEMAEVLIKTGNKEAE